LVFFRHSLPLRWSAGRWPVDGHGKSQLVYLVGPGLQKLATFNLIRVPVVSSAYTIGGRVRQPKQVAFLVLQHGSEPTSHVDVAACGPCRRTVGRDAERWRRTRLPRALGDLKTYAQRVAAARWAIVREPRLDGVNWQ
jgi:hypothetical protein